MSAQKAQSILELSIFGAIILGFLGIFLSYGLQNNYTQQIQQQAFRKAIAAASRTQTWVRGFRWGPTPSGSATYVILRDRHTPNPSDPFAVGGTSPSGASYSITRDFELSSSPDTVDEIPRIHIEINGQSLSGGFPPGFLSAGFNEYWLPEECSAYGLQKYQEIFGQGRVWFPSAGANYVQVLDSCEGEIIDYGSCKAQCRMFTDVGYCAQECEKSRAPGAAGDCAMICSAQIQIPPYCPELDNMFSFAIVDQPNPSMGVQPDYSAQFVQNSVLNKAESPGGITTNSAINWQNTAMRRIIFKPYHQYTAATMNADTSVGENENVPINANW